MHHVMVQEIERCEIVGGVKGRKEFMKLMGSLANEKNL
jgi:hypothetical protein